MSEHGSIELSDWVTSLCISPESQSIFASTANGSLHQLPLDATKWNSINSNMTNLQAHNAPIHKILTSPSNSNMLYSCSDDSTVKLWDLRTGLNDCQFTLKNSRNLPFFSMDIRHGLISAGSQLKGTDSELVLWDTRKLDETLRTFIDSHNDDITETKFHPTRKNILLSGATDGYVNIYDLNIVDEDDAQLQCINYSSVHSAGFTNNNRIYILSHMETFGLFDLSSEKDLNPEIESNVDIVKKGDIDFGDIRGKWDCEYVIDLYSPGYIGCGSNSKNVIKYFEVDLENENFDPNNKKSWTLEGGHGEEIVRDMSVFNNIIYTAGEDNFIRVWNGDGIKNTERVFVDDGDDNTTEEPEERMDVEYDISKKEKKKKKDRKHKKSKKDSKAKKHRFKPY